MAESSTLQPLEGQAKGYRYAISQSEKERSAVRPWRVGVIWSAAVGACGRRDIVQREVREQRRG
jgi:hypothetical protein